jgi:hypothetical protein
MCSYIREQRVKQTIPVWSKNLLENKYSVNGTVASDTKTLFYFITLLDN